MKKAILILCLLALLYVVTMPPPRLSAITPTIAASTQDFRVTGSPTITAAHIEKVLDLARSPARGTAQALYTLGVQSGIDPIYALAFFEHESSFGKYGIAATNLGLGNIRCTNGYTCASGFRAYGTWQAGYEDWYRLIRWYCDGLKKCTIEQIVPTYAPASENDTVGYITAIEQAVSTWRHH